MVRAAASARRATPGRCRRACRRARRRGRRGRRRAARSRRRARAPGPGRRLRPTNVSAAVGASGPDFHSAISSGRTPVSTSAELEALDARERGGEAAQRLGLARERAAGDGHARAAADRRQPLDGLEGRVVGAELQALRREGARAARRSGVPSATSSAGRAVDRVDADERRVALGAARRADRAGDAVARDQLAAARPARRRCRRRRRRARAARRARSPSRCRAARRRPRSSRRGARRRRRRRRRPRGRPRRGPTARGRRASRAGASGARPRPRPPRRRLRSATLVGLGDALGLGDASRPRRRRWRRLASPPPSSPPESREDAVDEVGLAQPAEAVDAELRGDDVQVCERARLEGVAMQNGHVSSLSMVSVGNPTALGQRPATPSAPAG